MAQDGLKQFEPRRKCCFVSNGMANDKFVAEEENRGRGEGDGGEEEGLEISAVAVPAAGLIYSRRGERGC